MDIRVAAVQYCHRQLTSFEQFASQLEGYISTGADYGAKVVVLPELFTFQLLSLHAGLSARKSITPFVEYSSQVLLGLADVLTNNLAQVYPIEVKV